LQARVTVLGDGAIGESVWIRREPAGEALRAHVVAPGIVEVAFR
jgi:flagella basal body P-ring formation protein FlgA